MVREMWTHDKKDTATRRARVFVCMLCFVFLGLTAKAGAVYYAYPYSNTGADFSENWPNENHPALGECFGNCGAGCSDTFGFVCGGRAQYWELQIVGREEDVPGVTYNDVLCYLDSCYYYTFQRVQAMGRWVYHGHSAAGCVLHDGVCPEATFLGCALYAGCGTEWDEDWSYDTVVGGWSVRHIQDM